MAKYIVKRLLLSVLILFGVSLICYILIRMMPADFIDNLYNSKPLDSGITPADIDRMKALYGLSDSSFMGIIKGYFGWLSNVLQGDLGLSFKHGQPVATVIYENMGVSFLLAFLAEIIRYAIAIPLGMITAKKQYGVADYSVTTAAMIGISLPSFFLSALLIRVFAVELQWFPVSGLFDVTAVGQSPFVFFLDVIYHLVIPILTITLLGVGGLMRYTRTNTLEVLNADYIRTARAKGLSERNVLGKHAFRNTLIPIVTLMAGTLPGLFGGAMILEKVFAIPGIGLMAYEALAVGDIPFVMGYNMFLAVLTVIGTLLSDLMYAVVDPRIKLAR